MGRSILQDERTCLVTGSTDGLDLHHIYHGPLRKVSDHMGFTCWLRHDVHMMLHARQKPFDKLDDELKRACQEAFEGMGHTRREFMALIGRSYL